VLVGVVMFFIMVPGDLHRHISLPGRMGNVAHRHLFEPAPRMELNAAAMAFDD
jgi:hypothetical protein